MTSGAGRHEAPPWGWWLRLEGADYRDEEGGRWRSVRDAFWRGHLRMPDGPFADEQQELLLRVLASVDERGTLAATSAIDLFDGNAMMWRFHLCWLASIGLLDMTERRIDLSPPSPFEAGLSEEGRSVMTMLRLTRKREWERLPMREVVEAVARSGWSPDDQAREAALQAFERSVGRRRWTFARERLPNAFLVTLTGISAQARMPTLGIMWSIAFAEADQRDDLFAWFATHVDRWEDWGDMAYGKGADQFTRHLVSLLVADAGSMT